MNKHILNDNVFFTWRNTPWDENIFKKKTLEILEFKYENEVSLIELFEKIEDLVSENEYEMIYFRYNSSDITLKKYAIAHGFEIVEHSYYVYHQNIKKLNLSKSRLKFRSPEDTDIQKIKEIVRESFLHGRFHEDPFIDLELAKSRYENWIPQLIKETNFFVFEIKGQVAGFFNYTIKDGVLDLPLSGLSKDFSGLGGYMWNDMFEFIRENEETKKIKIMISASNIAVLNLYIGLGFRVSESLFGYHKHI